jgi:hypothetical protein
MSACERQELKILPYCSSPSADAGKEKVEASGTKYKYKFRQGHGAFQGTSGKVIASKVLRGCTYQVDRVATKVRANLTWICISKCKCDGIEYKQSFRYSRLQHSGFPKKKSHRYGLL